MNEFLATSVGTYLSYCTAFCIRYFAVAGGIYWCFHVLFKQQWLVYRIQQEFPARNEVVHAIRWSMVNMACTGLFTILFGVLIHAGGTRMYFGLADHGWPYLGFSVLAVLLGYDAWMYWEHRLMHTPWLFRHVHAVHHRTANPTAFSTFACHPLEAFMNNAYFLLFAVLVPVHPVAIAVVGGFMFVVGLVGHLGYEFYPAGFTRHHLFQWFNTSTHHNLHHSAVGCNYTIWLNCWDRLMGTNHPRYHDAFDALTQRPRVMPPLSSIAHSEAVSREAA
jgi:sterol desaturase/sphingolipid hydroxylase (fatty acid hydroxylase superfamily)